MLGPLRFHLIGFDISCGISEWIHHFDNVTMLVFLVDLRRYDEGVLEESITLFDSLVNHPVFVKTSVILLLANYPAFVQKLSDVPFENYFPDYCGGRNGARAVEYIRFRFMQRNRAMLNIYPRTGEVDDPGLRHLTFATAKEILLCNELRSAGMI